MSIHSQDETERSKPHRHIEKILDKMRIAYESEVPFGKFAVDIYLNEWHIAIEVDGPAHSPRRDAIRDDNLREKYFLPVLRLKTSNNLSFNSIMTIIEDFIIEWSKTGEQRKSQYMASI
jgi:very-short-patch-repair endonuclease